MRSARVAIVCLIPGVAAVPVAASGGGGGSSLIEPNVGTIFWTVVTFVILAFLLGRYAWKPLLGALQERERSIQESIDQARGNREQAEKLLDEQRQLLDQARRERAEAVAAGQRDAEKVKAEILEEAREQREKLLNQTQAQVEAGLRQARSELRGIAADLALRAAEKLLVKNLDDASQRKLVEDYLADLERSNSPPS
jgi:F-type H+-transporting ATPase subunit b